MKIRPTPWYADAFGNITTHPPRKGLRAFLPTTGIVAKCNRAEEAEHIVKCVNDAQRVEGR